MKGNSEKYKPWIILGSGFLTLILMYSFPVDGGGMSLVFVLTIPGLIILSLILSLIYKWFAKKLDSLFKRNLLFLFELGLILFLTSWLFPCSDDDSLCPCATIYNSIIVAENYNKINYNDLFVEKIATNYPLIVTARKKFKNNLPNKIYYISYAYKDFYRKEKTYAIYIKEDSIYSSNKKLLITKLNDSLTQYSEIFKSDTISFKGVKNGFKEMKDEYYSYNDNGYGYITWIKQSNIFEITIRKEVENDIVENYIFYKLLYWIM